MNFELLYAMLWVGC